MIIIIIYKEKTMEYLFDRFINFIDSKRDASINKLYNEFIYSVSDEEAEFISNNFMLFIKTGEAYRNAPVEVREMIKIPTS